MPAPPAGVKCAARPSGDPHGERATPPRPDARENRDERSLFRARLGLGPRVARSLLRGRGMKRSSTLLGIALALTSGLAAAEPREPAVDAGGTEPARAGTAADRRLHVALGGWLSGGTSTYTPTVDGEASFGIGLELLLRHGLLQLGPIFSAESPLFADSSSMVGGILGVVGEVEDARLRLDLAAEGGVHFVAAGAGMFSDVVGGDESAEMPYVGARAGASVLLGRTRRTFFGPLLSARTDLGHGTLSPVVRDCFLGCTTEQEHRTVGGTGFMIALRVGGDLGG
jgi:hypothetical protein